MNQKNTHITLLNKKERFAFHFGDVLLIVLFYTILIILIDAIFEIKQSLDLNVFLFGLIYFLYFLIFESIYGTSPLKMKTAHVVNKTGEKPSFTVTLLRTICRFIPLDSLSFLFLKRGRGLHDILSGTQVVKKFKRK